MAGLPSPPVRMLLALLFLPCVLGHGLMTIPAQRGALSPFNKFNSKGKYPSAPADQKAHFPAGDKDKSPGAAVRSQIKEAGPAGWGPFAPLESDFKWRAGVCGDLKSGKQDHMRGGYYYFNGLVTQNYTQGQVIEIEINIVAHHNGFVQLHVCDVAKCGGEISEKCFKDGHCSKLLRAPNPSCDSGMDKRCGPIDPDYPGRWYLPCTTVPENTQERFGNDKMLYKLPEDLVCDHCVIHWFWSAANTCNPPGVIEYFEGPNGPKTWGNCFGQGGARGGYTKVQKDCAKDRFPEEYYTCADVAIKKDVGSKSEGAASPSPEASPSITVTPSPGAPKPYMSIAPVPSRGTPLHSMGPSSGTGIFKHFELVADGKVIQSLPDRCAVDIRGYKEISIEAVTLEAAATFVTFFIDGTKEWTDYQMPYFLFGNRKRVPNYWADPIVNKVFLLRVEADGDYMESRIYFMK